MGHQQQHSLVVTNETVKVRLEQLKNLIQDIKRSGGNQMDDGSGFTYTHRLYSLVHFALNCPIFKTTYYLLMELCSLLITSFQSRDAFIFNFYDSEESIVDCSIDIKSQLFEKLLECHHICLTAFYPANETTGKNNFEKEEFDKEVIGMAPAA